jgi:excisionase family DNA binding protein
MATAVTINGVAMLPIKEAARGVRYSRDYVARLAREKKITAVHIGRSWYVDFASLQRFAAYAELEQKARHCQLGLERKRERAVIEELERSSEKVARAARRAPFNAMAGAFMVLAIGVFFGHGLYTAAPVLTSGVYQLAFAPFAKPLPAPSFSYVQEQPLPFGMSLLERPVFTASYEKLSFPGANGEGVVLLPNEGAVRTPKEVAALFSDEVLVNFTESGMGTVTIIDADGRLGTSTLSFVVVPVKSAAASPMR